jgi:2-polyprenyl-3-methyl-5-hydroxy-6-metoxy-1,4-benzoquinol methylase
VTTQAAAPNDQPNPSFVMQILNSYQRTAALRAAIQLDLFTAIAEGNETAAAIAGRCKATERGIRILCDYLTIVGLLAKHDKLYSLSQDAAIFLNRKSPAYVGTITDFLVRAETLDVFMDLADTIRDPEKSLRDRAVMKTENPAWVEFARAMGPLMTIPAAGIAETVGAAKGESWKVLDIAAGHGMFGIAIAQQNPNAEIFALDWAPVLEVARENAKSAGVGARHHLLPGSFFDRDLGTGYHLALITNFLHHFDIAAGESILEKVRGVLAPGGRVVILDFIPNDDRVTPPAAAAFSMTMLGHTIAGDAYTFAEYQRMLGNAGYASSEIHPLPGPLSVIISQA